MSKLLCDVICSNDSHLSHVISININTTIQTKQHTCTTYRFEALEYAGILKEAQSTKEGDAIIAKTRDYLLRTADGIRVDIRTNLNPNAVKERIDRSMKRDKPGTTGFGIGAFFGFVL